jgi:hypothetical protein
VTPSIFGGCSFPELQSFSLFFFLLPWKFEVATVLFNASTFVRS